MCQVEVPGGGGAGYGAKIARCTMEMKNEKGFPVTEHRAPEGEAFVSGEGHGIYSGNESVPLEIKHTAFSNETLARVCCVARETRGKP